MGRFVRGDIVVLPFPFSDLSNSKCCPALVIAELDGVDILVCQITSQSRPKDTYSIELTSQNLKTGSLTKDSWIRPGRLFTAEEKILLRKIGSINDSTMTSVIETIFRIIGLPKP